MRISKLILTGSLLLALAACSKNKPPRESADNATFLSDPVTGIVDETPSSASFAGIPKDRNVQFTACLKDIAVQERIIGAKFQVTNGARVLPMKRSDTDQTGCIRWSEVIPFDATQPETYYEVDRQITATTVHQGTITVRIGIDPWKTGGGSVRDLSVQGAPDTRPLGAKVNSVSSVDQNGLVVDSVDTNFEITKSDESGSTANVLLTFEPKFRHLGLDGHTPAFDSVTNGQFKVTARIVAVNGDDRVNFTSIFSVPKAGFVQGMVRASGTVKLLNKIRRESTMELEFQAEPLDDNLKRFGVIRGRAVLGRLTSFSFDAKRDLEAPSGSPALSAVAKSLQASPDDDKGVTLGFELGRVSVQEVVVKDLDDSGKPKSLEVEYRTLVKNGVTQDLVLGQKFEVDGQPAETDDEESYLHWKETVPFDYFAAEKYVPKTVSVVAKNKFYSGVTQDRQLFCDYWNYESPESVCLDKEKDGEPSHSVADEENSSAQLMISSVMFNFTSRSFDVDALLNLSGIRNYRFEIEPTIQRMTPKGWSKPEGLGTGRFLVKFLLETTDADNPEVIDARSAELECRNGKITASIGFHLPDVRYAATRTNLTVQVMPIGRSSLQSQPFEGTFDMLGGFAVRLEPRDSKIDDRMKLAPKENKLLQYTGAQLYAQNKKLELLDAPALQALGIAPDALNNYLLKQEEGMLGKLCGLFFEPGGWNPFSSYRRCTGNAKGWLALVNTQHMNKLYTVKQAGPPEGSQIGISAGIGYSEGKSYSSSDSISADIGIKASVDVAKLLPVNKILGFFDLGIGAGVGYGHSWSWSKSSGSGSSRGYDESKSINVDEIDFDIDADVDHCVIFTLLDPPKGTKGYMACAAAPIRKKFTEHYYHIYQNARPGPIQDDGAALNDRPLIALVRGTERFNDLKKLLQDPDISLNLGKPLPVPYKLWKDSEQRYDGFFPGLLTQ